MTSPKKSDSATTTPKRRTPISRAEGERRLIEATIELVRTTPISEVGVRDIARKADVNHGFVHTWFGSKNDLLVRALRTLVQQLAESTSANGITAATPLNPDVQLIVKLLMWLFLEDFETGGLVADGAFVKALAAQYVSTIGLPESIAYTAAQQAVAIGISTVILGDIIGTSSQADVQRAMDLWSYNLRLLAKYPPA